MSTYCLCEESIQSNILKNNADNTEITEFLFKDTKNYLAAANKGVMDNELVLWNHNADGLKVGNRWMWTYESIIYQLCYFISQ